MIILATVFFFCVVCFLISGRLSSGSLGKLNVSPRDRGSVSTGVADEQGETAQEQRQPPLLVPSLLLLTVTLVYQNIDLTLLFHSLYTTCDSPCHLLIFFLFLRAARLRVDDEPSVLNLGTFSDLLCLFRTCIGVDGMRRDFDWIG